MTVSRSHLALPNGIFLFVVAGALLIAAGPCATDLAGPIATAVEHDDDLVGEAEGPEAVAKLPLLVMDDDEGREGRRSGPVHAATLSTECHRRRAPVKKK